MCSRLPLELWSSLLLSGGLAVQSARLVGPHREPFLRFVRRTVPAARRQPAGDHAGDIGRRAWSEHRAVANLPPPPADARNVLLDRLGYGAGRESEPPRLWSPDVAQPRAAGRPGRAVRSGFRDRPLDPAVAQQPVHRAVAPRADGRLADRRSTRPTPRSPSISARMAMTPPDSSPTWTTAAGKPA